MNVVRRPDQIGVAFVIFGMFIFVLFKLTLGSEAILFLPTLDGHIEINPVAARSADALAIVLPMFIASGLSFDFRGDMGQIDVLKAQFPSIRSS